MSRRPTMTPPGSPSFYTDEERTRMTKAAGERVAAALPPASENSTAFVLVVTTRSPEGKASFSSVTNLDARGAARLLVRAAIQESEDGVSDVLSSLPVDRQTRWWRLAVGNAEAGELSQARIELERLRAVLTKMAAADEWSGGVWFRGTAQAALRDGKTP